MKRRSQGVGAGASGMLAVALLSMTTSSCGYALAGRGSFLPDYIETIGIPLFVNNTRIFEIERVVTERVRSEFIARGSYTVVSQSTGVDALLEGRIVSITLEPAAFTGDQQASRYVLIMQVSIIMHDVTTDEVLWSDPALVFREEYEIASTQRGVGAAAFFGQDRNAVERIAADFAKTIVSAILEAF